MLKNFIGLIGLVIGVTVVSPCRPVHAATAVGVYLQYSVASVTPQTYVDLVTTTAHPISKISVFDSGGQVMRLAVCTSPTYACVSGQELTTIFIPPGGGDYPLNISQGSRVSLKGVSGTAATGQNVTNLFYD